MKILMPRPQSSAIAPLPKLLETFGHQVDVPASYEEAQASYERVHHALIIVDLTAEAEAGLNFSCTIRKREAGADPFIVALTNGETLDVARQALDRGASDVWSSAMDAQRLAICTEVALRKAHERADRKFSEARLKFEHERHKYILAGLEEGCWDWELPDGDWQSAQKKVWNAGPFLRLMGFPENDSGMANESWESFVHPEDRGRVEQALRQHIEQGQPFHITCRMRGRRSEYRWYRNQGRAIFSKDGTIRRIVGSIRDISVQKQMEERMLINQRMEALGAMAGCVAHDFNNVLLDLQGQCDLLALSLPETSDSTRHMFEMKKAIGRAIALSTRLLTVARKPDEEPEAVNLNDILNDMNNVLQQLLGARIYLEKDLDNGLANIEAVPGQLWQILLNLVLNARDAIEQDGHVLISTRNLRHAQSQHVSNTLGPGEFVVLTVSDTGCGMDADTKERIFEPFFTTKPEGRGTGLGLVTVARIIKECGGEVEVESAPGKGASVSIYLPVATQQASVRPR